MKQLKIILLLFFLIPLSSGCERNIFCPGFPENLHDYFPYEKGETLSFTNENGKILNFEISNFRITEDHYIPKCGKCACNPCGSTFQAITDEKSEIPVKLIGSVQFENQQLKLDFSFGYYDRKKYGDCFSTTITPETKGVISIENKREVTRISSIQTEKGKGVISFYDKLLDCTWKLVEN